MIEFDSERILVTVTPASSSSSANNPASSESGDVSLTWDDLDRRAVDTARVLAMDAVQQVGNGHPGTAMALAPAAYLLFQRFLRHDPSDPTWLGRDRFVLSNGHASLTLYTQLFLSGYGLELADLKQFRRWGSKTPGHPEYGHTAGVETTTGPLGQGLANGVGMAMDGRYVRGMLDAAAPAGTSPFDHTVWVFAGDGCLQEGITAEASSLAGHQKLGNLVVIYDDNHISIEGDTMVAFSEDVEARYRAYGWHTLLVDLDPNGGVDVPALAAAMKQAQAELTRPTLIRLRTVIGWPAPHLQNTGKAHGTALGADEVAATKELLGFDPQRTFQVDDEVLAHARQVGDRGRDLHAAWQQRFDAWQESHPEKSAVLDRMVAGDLPDGWDADLPEFPAGTPVATRKASGKVLQVLAAKIPELWGGSADLAESNDTTIEGGMSFLPEGNPAPQGSAYGRIVHFGIREHAMGAILNGIAVGGLTRAFGGTFLTFSDYMRGAVRLAALMGVPSTFVWTHDSIGLGEDGPTHQPVEHLWALRAIPGLAVVRPADANETTVAWTEILRRRKPTGLILTRQNLPTLDRDQVAAADGLARGAYVLAEASGGPVKCLLLATGSEVSIALDARDVLQAEGIPTRVVSAPCLEWFEEQDLSYRDTVLPPTLTARVSVEAGIAQGWWRYVGSQGRCISLEHFGASADYQTLYREFGITTEAVVSAAHASLGD